MFFQNQKLIKLLSPLLTGVILVIPSVALAEDPIQVALAAGTGGADIIRNVWETLLNAANVVALVAFLFIAFANIFRFQINTYAIKKILPSVIIAIIAANLSFLISRILIDVSVALSAMFLADAKALITNFENLTGVQTSLKALQDSNTGNQAVNSIINPGQTDTNAGTSDATALFIGAILKLVGSLFVLVLGFMFILRVYIIYFLVAISPIAFISMALPFSKGIWSRWWKTFGQWVFMAPIACFWLWLGSQFWDYAARFNLGTEAQVVENFSGLEIVSFIFAIVCMYLAMTTPFKMAGELSSLAGKVQNIAMGVTGINLGRTVMGNVGQAAKEYGEIAALKLTPYGPIKRLTNIGKQARQATIATAESGTVFQGTIGKGIGYATGLGFLAEGAQWLAAKTLEDQKTGKDIFENRLAQVGERAKSAKKEAEAEKAKELLSTYKEINKVEAEHLKLQDEDFQKLMRRIRTIKETKEADKEKKKSQQELKYLSGELYTEANQVSRLLRDDSYKAYHMARQDPMKNPRDEVARAMGYADEADAIAKGKGADLNKKITDHEKNYNRIFAQAYKIQKRNVGTARAKLAGAPRSVKDIQDTLDYYNKNKKGEGYRALSVHAAAGDKMAAQAAIEKRKGDTQNDYMMQHLHDIYQRQRVWEISRNSANNINNALAGTGSNDEEKELFGIAEDLRLRGVQIRNASDVRNIAQGYQEMIQSDPDFHEIVQTRYRSLVGKFIADKATGDAETDSPEESIEAFNKVDLKQRRLFVRRNLAPMSALSNKQLYRKAQTAARAMKGYQLTGDYMNWLKSIRQLIESDDPKDAAGNRTDPESIGYHFDQKLRTATQPMRSPLGALPSGPTAGQYEITSLDQFYDHLEVAMTDPRVSREQRSKFQQYMESAEILKDLGMSKDTFIGRAEKGLKPDIAVNA